MMFNIEPKEFATNPMVAITPDDFRYGHVVGRVFSSPYIGTIRVEAHSPYTREVFYEGVSMGVYELNPEVEARYGNDH